jgi:Holliday junction DNA helicase RuvB
MEDFRIDIILGDGINARTINFNIQPFTLIGATTRAGMLSGPLRDRFQVREHLGFYTEEELAEIVRRNAIKLHVELDDRADSLIASRSRGTPRIAINRLRWTRDYAETRADGRITPDVSEAALAMAGVDELGLEKLDRQYLKTLIEVFAGGPTGVEALAHTINTAVDTLSDEIEPYLLRSALVVRTPRGRVATAKAYQHLKMPPPDDSSDEDDRQPQLF